VEGQVQQAQRVPGTTAATARIATLAALVGALCSLGCGAARQTAIAPSTVHAPPAAAADTPVTSPTRAPATTKAASPGIHVPASDRGAFDALPANHREALDQLARLRRRMGLPAWRFSAELSAAGQAHVRYHVRRCKAGKPPDGHFERRSDPGYSAEGDRAARSSGISFGSKTPEKALEGFLAGPYHRAQFVARVSGRVGVASGGSAARQTFQRAGSHARVFMNCGIHLFPFKRDRARRSQVPRFIRFPPDGWTDVPTLFPGERPDPRPPGARPTGYPATIHLLPRDSKYLTAVQAVIRGPDGAEVPLWLADPTRPAVKKPPMGIYGAGGVVADKKRSQIQQAYSRNFDQVMLMPQRPLKANTRYAIEATLTIDGQTHRLNWWFHTRKASRSLLRDGGASGLRRVPGAGERRSARRGAYRPRAGNLSRLSAGWPGEVATAQVPANVHALAPDTLVGRSMVIRGAPGGLSGGPLAVSGAVGRALTIRRAALVKDSAARPGPNAPMNWDRSGRYLLILGDPGGRSVDITLDHLTIAGRGRLLVVLPGARVLLRDVRLSATGPDALMLLPGSALTMERSDLRGLSHAEAIGLGPRPARGAARPTALVIRQSRLPTGLQAALKKLAAQRTDFNVQGVASRGRP